MTSFDISYDGEDDYLEVTFAVFDENVSRTVPLNDHIFLFSDLALQTVWGLTFYSYRRLLGVSETDLTSLRGLPAPQVESVLGMLSRPPASHFFDLTDPEGLIARINGPSLHALLQEEP